MSCVYNCNDGDILFPESLACVLRDGYGTEDKSEIVNGFGGRRIVSYMGVDIVADVLVGSRSDMAILAHWYYNEVNSGTTPFKINIPVFGVQKAWLVKMTNRLNESSFSGSTRKIKLELSLIDDIRETINDDAASMLCEICE